MKLAERIFIGIPVALLALVLSLTAGALCVVAVTAVRLWVRMERLVVTSQMARHLPHVSRHRKLPS